MWRKAVRDTQLLTYCNQPSFVLPAHARQTRFGLFSKHSLRETLTHAYDTQVKFQRCIEADTLISSLIPTTSRTQYRADSDLDSATSVRLIHFYGGGRLSLLCGVECYWYYCSIECSSLVYPCHFVTGHPALSSQLVVVVHLQALEPEADH